MHHREHLDQIQILRGIAALCVFVFHLGVTLDRFTPVELRPLLNWGNVGVDLFFVISGFVMTHSVRNISGPSAAGAFLVRRLWRIAPLLYILTIVALWVSAAQGRGFDLARIANCFTIFPLMQSPHQYQYALVQAWTLGYELGFYLIVAAIVALNLRWRLFTMAATIAVLPLIAPILPFSDNIIVEFAFGVGAYALWQRAVISPLVAWLALAAAALLVAFPVGDARFLDYGLPSAFLFLAVLAWKPSGAIAKIGLWLGTISYSMYLSHTITFNLLVSVAPFLPLAATAALMAAAGILLSWLTYEAAEAPLQRWRPGSRFRRSERRPEPAGL